MGRIFKRKRWSFEYNFYSYSLLCFIVFFFYAGLFVFAIIFGTKGEIIKRRNQKDLIDEIVYECDLLDKKFSCIKPVVNTDYSGISSRKRLCGFSIVKYNYRSYFFDLQKKGYSQPVESYTYNTSLVYLKKIKRRVGGHIQKIQVYHPSRGGGGYFATADGGIGTYGPSREGYYFEGYELISKQEMNRRKLEEQKIWQEKKNVKNL